MDLKLYCFGMWENRKLFKSGSGFEIFIYSELLIIYLFEGFIVCWFIRDLEIFFIDVCRVLVWFIINGLEMIFKCLYLRK